LLSTVNKLDGQPVIVVTLAQSILSPLSQSEFYAVANRLDEILGECVGSVLCVVDVRSANIKSGERVLALLDTLRLRAHNRFTPHGALIVTPRSLMVDPVLAANPTIAWFASLEDAMAAFRYRMEEH
jgi:hypothetical protein